MKQALPVRKHELEIGLKRPSPRIAVDGAEGGYEKLGLARDVTEYVRSFVRRCGRGRAGPEARGLGRLG